MALLPSGSREDVELVQIETEKCSLIIKGKPYHERYEGLKQYRAMDSHDVMEFTVDGHGIQEYKVYDVQIGQLVFPSNLRPIFFENGIYQVIVVSKTGEELTFYHEHPVLRKAITPVKIGNHSVLMGNLHFQNEVGQSTIEIHQADKTILTVTLEIFPVKLDYKRDYQKLLEEVNDEIYNLAYHFIRKTYLGASVKIEGKPSKAEFYRLMSRHFNQFIHAIEHIEHQPNHRLQTIHEKARGDQLRRLDSTSRSYLRKRTSLFVEVQNGVEIDKRQLMPREGLRMRKELTYDTLENQYVKWMMVRLIHKLTDLINAIQSENNRWKQLPDFELIEKIISMRTQLEKKLHQFFWRQISKLDRSVMSLVMQMAPGYRDAFQIYLTVSKGLALQGKFYQMSVKDVATLYEYWTYLKLGQILSRKYDLVSQDIIRVNHKGLFVNLDVNSSSKRVFQHPVTKEKIVLTYQKYVGRLPTIPQKPDMVLQISKKGKNYSYNYIFDAKYRIDYAQAGSYYHSRYFTPGPMEDDINTMHRYRDSIVAAKNGPYERTAFGAYVLFPWGEEYEYQHHHFYKSINEVNIGGLPFLPNATALVETFVERLIDAGPEEIQNEGILPKGTLEAWSSSLEEKVLVGLVSSEEDYRRFRQEGCFVILGNCLRKGWQEAKHIALYVKNGVGSINGVVVYGEIIQIHTEKETVRFEVNHWKALDEAIKPVGYGIANYIMTTLNTLQESKELPELFMKSKDEMILWRILRRVSDQIKLDLDAAYVDEAKNVMEYEIKDISIQLKPVEQEIILTNRNVSRSMSLEVLERNPTAVFKVLVELLSD
ncbi:restriction endonuclease-like protein [Bacillus sp. FJAT-49705]|uniref:Restriction endonuclease-like protein n=1 Tax=Cytobacillus citreus TaxID=2833586 RepID=A0ABS5NZF4_9BACI|nr:restriction endonuclease-like protein [Cytobacillus citreus]MBS4193213.1 restriction endonuclease-like protein [Cytobacillus citreus]